MLSADDEQVCRSGIYNVGRFNRLPSRTAYAAQVGDDVIGFSCFFNEEGRRSRMACDATTAYNTPTKAFRFVGMHTFAKRKKMTIENLCTNKTNRM
jgi:hypothetical protein